MKSRLTKIGTTTLILLLASAAGCFEKRDDAAGGRGGSGGLTAEALPEEPTVGSPQLAQLAMGLGSRDFGQLNQTMASLTGIDPRATGARNTYNAVSASLPNSNDLLTVAGPQIVAVTRLAAQYCDLAAAAAAAGRSPQREMFPGVAFGSALANVSDTVRDNVIQALLTRFNREESASPDDVAELRQLFSELKAARIGTNPVSTTGAMVSLCTAALGSAKAVIAL